MVTLPLFGSSATYQHLTPPLAAPSRHPLVIKTFTDKIQLGLLLRGPLEVELHIIAIEFLLSMGDGEVGSEAAPEPQLAMFQSQDTPCFETLSLPHSPCAHQPRQSQVTDDGQKYNYAGCDEIAEGAF